MQTRATTTGWSCLEVSQTPTRCALDREAVRFVRGSSSGKPVGVICHGPWTLIEAEVVRGRTLTSWPSLQTDLRNAGAKWVDEEVHVDRGLISSRKPDDLQGARRGHGRGPAARGGLGGPLEPQD